MTDDTQRLSAALDGRYRIVRQLGTGGMATVYLCEDLKHDRKVALKVLKPELAAVLGADRFIVEIKTTAALQHPHILPLFDSGTADGFLYYVMPYVAGETIRDRLNRETQLPVDEAVRIAREIADALDYAHRSGVIHRDIKPENILLHDGRAMVMDFGIALAVSAAAGGRMTETGLSLGTPHYMSPEQATAEKELTGRSDVYSLASVLFEMLAGEPPHLGNSAQQIIMKIITDTARPVTDLRKSVPQHVAAAVAKGLEKLPADRFATAKQFSDALASETFAYGSAAGTRARASGTTTRGSLAPDRKTRSALIGISALAAVLLATTTWSLTRPTPPRDVSRFSIHLGDGFSQLAAAARGSVALAPDGRTIVYVGTSDRGVTQLLVRRLDELVSTPLVGTEGALNPSFSPNGREVAFITSSPRVLKTVALAGGATLTRADSLVDIGGVAWGTDGYIYYDSKFAGDVMARVRETGGPPEPATVIDTTLGERYHYRPAALPDGRGMLFVISRGPQAEFRIGVRDARTGKHKTLVRGVMAQYAASGHLVFVTADGTLMAARFDLESLELRGEPRALFGGVATTGGTILDVALSATGLFTYRTGGSTDTRQLAWLTRSGVWTPVDTGFAGSFITAWLSPDATSALVLVGQAPGGDADLVLKHLDRGTKVKLAERVRSASWSPDGRRVAVIDTTGISIGPVDGSAPLTRILRLSRLQQLQWSNDGRWLIFVRAGDVLALSTAGDTTPVTLTSGPSVDNSPRLSPDGRWLAYLSDRSGRFELYVSPFAGSQQARQQQVSDGGVLSSAAGAPRWTHDGRTLVFVSEQRELMAVPVLPGEVFTFDTPRRLLPLGADAGVSAYDVSPDGQRILAVRSVALAAATAPELILVQNFFEELNAKVPVKR